MANQSRPVFSDSSLPVTIVVAVITFVTNLRHTEDGQPQEQSANTSPNQAGSEVDRSDNASETTAPISIRPLRSSPSLISTSRQSYTTHGSRRAADRAPEGCATNPVCISSDDDDDAVSDIAAPPSLIDEVTLPSLDDTVDDTLDDYTLPPTTDGPDADPSMCLSSSPCSDSERAARARAATNSKVEMWRYGQENCEDR